MSNILKHNDYIGVVGFSAEDEVFFGTVHGISDVVTFEGSSVEELKNAFVEAVDDYIEFCRKIGKEPQKSYKGSFNVRVSPDIHKKAALKACELGLSLNQYVEKSLADSLNEERDRLSTITQMVDNCSAQLQALSGKMWSNVHLESYNGM